MGWECQLLLPGVDGGELSLARFYDLGATGLVCTIGDFSIQGNSLMWKEAVWVLTNLGVHRGLCSQDNWCELL